MLIQAILDLHLAKAPSPLHSPCSCCRRSISPNPDAAAMESQAHCVRDWNEWRTDGGWSRPAVDPVCEFGGSSMELSNLVVICLRLPVDKTRRGRGIGDRPLYFDLLRPTGSGRWNQNDTISPASVMTTAAGARCCISQVFDHSLTNLYTLHVVEIRNKLENFYVDC
jgi:hypothetical protein